MKIKPKASAGSVSVGAGRRGGGAPCLAAAAAIGLVALAAGAAAQTGPQRTGPQRTGPHTPAPGSAERKAILLALRLPVARMLKGPVAFAISYFRAQGRWAFLIAVPRRPDGSAIDYSDTKWGDAARRMRFKDEIVALIYRHGVKTWRVVWYVIGATEPPWGDWARRYRAPKSLFPKIKHPSPFD